MKVLILMLIIIAGLAFYGAVMLLAVGLAAFNDKCGKYFKRRKNGKR